MAIFRPGVAVADLRGSVGGVTFSRNRSGLIMRTRVKPVDPLSQGQAEARERIRTIQEYWRDTLTAAQRAGWETLGSSMAGTNALGDRIRLTGVNHFIAVNALKLFAGEAILAAAPAPPAGCEIPTLTIAANTTAGISVTATDPAMPATDLLIGRLSAPHSPTRTFFKGPWTDSGAHLGSSVLPWVWKVPALVSIGQRWFMGFRYLTAEGRLSGYDFRILDITV